MRKTSILFALSAVLLVGLLAPTAQARNAPNPLPSWASLSPASTSQVLTNVSDFVGNYMWLGASLDKKVYVWDIAYAQLANGTIIVYKYELQAPNGDYVLVDLTSEIPSGTSFTTTSAGIYGSGFVYFTNPDGEITLDTVASFSGANTVGGGGQITFDPGYQSGPGRTTCGITGGILTCGNNCTIIGGGCSMTGGGWCACAIRACAMIRGTTECGGSCGQGQSCQNSGGGCSCL